MKPVLIATIAAFALLLTIAAASADMAHDVTQAIRATCYGDGEKLAKHTANGEVFDTRANTAAHRELPFGTRVHVRNPRNGKSVVVRINDRGPAKRTGNAIDLTCHGAARAIGFRSGPLLIEVR